MPPYPSGKPLPHIINLHAGLRVLITPTALRLIGVIEHPTAEEVLILNTTDSNFKGTIILYKVDVKDVDGAITLPVVRIVTPTGPRGTIVEVAGHFSQSAYEADWLKTFLESEDATAEVTFCDQGSVVLGSYAAIALSPNFGTFLRRLIARAAELDPSGSRVEALAGTALQLLDHYKDFDTPEPRPVHRLASWQSPS